MGISHLRNVLSYPVRIIYETQLSFCMHYGIVPSGHYFSSFMFAGVPSWSDVGIRTMEDGGDLPIFLLSNFNKRVSSSDMAMEFLAIFTQHEWQVIDF